MTSRCSQCGALTFSKEDPLDPTLPVATPWTIVRCQRLLKSNEPPDSAELAYMQPLVSKVAARLECIDDEMSRLRDRLEQLNTEQTELAEYHALHAPIVSPLRRMPPEVLMEIFLWTLPLGQDERDGYVSALKQSPWVLTQVSSRWRTISISTPSLWSRVSVDYSEGFGQPLRMVWTQVDRAGTRMLDVYFAGSAKRNHGAQVEMFQFLSLHSARWEVFEIENLTTNLVPHLAALRGRLPSLSNLCVTWDARIDDHQVGEHAFDCFQTAYRLVDVTLGDFLPVPLAAHQLTAYAVDCPWEMHHSVLKLASNLVEARVTVSSDDTDWPEASPDQVIDLPQLQRLYVSSQEVLRYLQAPILSEIGFIVAEDEELAGLDAFLVRCSCKPQQLLLEGLLDAEMTKKILEKHTFLNRILLVFTSRDIRNFDDNILASSIGAHLSMLARGIAPQLKDISLGTEARFGVDYPLFARMLRARRGPGSVLGAAAFVTIQGPSPDPLTLAELDALAKDGLSLVLQSRKDAERSINAWSYATRPMYR
ncbi:hypothetical protein FB45DRAFT_797861 [Roridomyces roridus]|uniref:F-box domain-containing protein n=1 Tax=Roridomyces roridus TaxID=1738132 RepID=A0AAD7BK99_9AGAR|nr:hypothetical protein FB45DRAFT_797861 [Roridomyces roridus]